MTEQRIKHLLKELQQELEHATEVDEEIIAMTRKLDADINALVDPEVDTSGNTVMDDAIALEASFAARYPVAERILRELINNLSKIGI